MVSSLSSFSCSYHGGGPPVGQYRYHTSRSLFNPLNAALNPICHLLALLRAHHILHVSRVRVKGYFNPLNAELNPICHLLALLGAHHIFHVCWIRVKGYFNPLNAELNTICHLLALLGPHHIFHVSGLRVNDLPWFLLPFGL